MIKLIKIDAKAALYLELDDNEYMKRILKLNP